MERHKNKPRQSISTYLHIYSKVCGFSQASLEQMPVQGESNPPNIKHRKTATIH